MLGLGKINLNTQTVRRRRRSRDMIDGFPFMRFVASVIYALVALLFLPCAALAEEPPRDEHSKTTEYRHDGECDDAKSRRSPAIVISLPRIEEFVLYAERSIVLGRHDVACGGDIGVRSIASGQAAQLSLDADAYVDPSHNLLAPSVTLKDDTRVGTVQASMLNGQATVTTAFPVLSMPALPLAILPAAGSVDVTVRQDMEYGLVPGNYGALDVRGRLLLTAGEYSFSEVKIAEFGAVVALTSGVRITAERVRDSRSVRTGSVHQPCIPAKTGRKQVSYRRSRSVRRSIRLAPAYQRPGRFLRPECSGAFFS